MDNFNEKTISCGLHTKWAGKTVYFAEETDSTNIWAKKLAKDGAPHGTLAVAEEQSAGRGRLGRSWTAPRGSSVMMTLVLRPDFKPCYGSMLTLLMGLSVAQACQRLGLDAKIKWPNDVVLAGKKICGILTEMSADLDTIHYVVIGTGINVNIREMPREIREMATSLQLELGRPLDRNEVLSRVLEAFETNYQLFTQSLDLSLVQREYNQLLINCGKTVKILDPAGEYTGVSQGINERGELLVNGPDGTIRSISSGEVSVRGLYGYV